VLDEPFELAGGDTVFITASVGIALTTANRTTAEALTRDADAAMYRAKEQGRARYQLFDATLRREVLERMQTEIAIRWAIERDELRLHYQPLVSLKNGGVVGFEALLRWEHPERGLLRADSVIPYVEDSALIIPIGEFVLEQAVRQLTSWVAADDAIWMTVNVAGRQLADPGFAARVGELLRESGLPADRLHLEITEATLVSEATGAATTIAQLAALGVGLVLDDFGTGYSALSYVQRFPLHAIKVDKSFVGRLARDKTQRAILGGIVNIAHAVGLRTVAEGVETKAQADIARELGCDLAQGFLFGKPTSADEAQSLIGLRPESRLRGSRG
jgi:Amt family ammonium transporter